MPTVEELARTAYGVYLRQPAATMVAYEDAAVDEQGYYRRFALMFLAVLERRGAPEDIAPLVMFKMFPAEDQLTHGVRQIWREAPDEVRSLYQLMALSLLQVVNEE